MTEFVRDSYGNVIGTALDAGTHPDQDEAAGPTHMFAIHAIPEGAHVGDLPDPVAELEAAKGRIATLEAARLVQANAELDAANARIAELEASAGAKTGDPSARIPAGDPFGIPPAV